MSARPRSYRRPITRAQWQDLQERAVVQQYGGAPLAPDDVENLLDELEWRKNNIRVLLACAGEEGRCRRCASVVFWVVHRNGKSTPYDENGLNHLLMCKP